MFKKWSICFAFLLCVTALCAKDIVIYHTSDIHGQYFGKADDNGKSYGGFARLANVLKKTKKPFLLLDSGDFSSGSYEANISDGKYSVDLMNRMGYTALTIGNHDSDFGDVGLGNMLSGFKGDVIAMNVSIFQIPNKELKGHALYNIGGIKVGVIGVAMDGAGTERMHVVNAPTTEEFEHHITELKKEGAEVIIVLAHDSLISDTTISVDKRTNILGPLSQAPSFGEVDLVLGGHAHTRSLNKKVIDDEDKGPWLVEDSSYLNSISSTVISKGRKGIKVHEPTFITLDGDEDQETKEYLDTIRAKQLDSKLYAKVPKLISKYPAVDQADRTSSVARIFADQMYDSIKPQESKLDLAAYSLNSTRSDYEQGDMTGRYFAEKTPYKEHAGTFDITGAHLLKAMNASVGFRDGRCYSSYGYSKNVHVTLLCDTQKKKATVYSVTIDGKDVKLKKIYRMAMLTHLPQGYYEGKPFKVVDPSNPEKNKIIKHYYTVTNADMLFGAIEKMKKEQGVEIPLFEAPADVQVQEINKMPNTPNKTYMSLLFAD